MWKEISKTIINTIVAAFFTLAVSFLIGKIDNPTVSVNYGYSRMDNNQYINTIMIKNIKKDDFIKNFVTIVDSSIKIQEVRINDKKIDVKKNSITIESIDPNDTQLITIISDNKINKNDYSFVNNGNKTNKIFMNEYFNYILYTIILVACYAIINFIISLRTDIDNVKIKENYDKIIKELRLKEEDINNKIDVLNKKSNARRILYIKEMADMEKEIDFYKDIIVKIAGKSITKDELEKIITNKTKTFSKRKIKHLDYDDISNVIVNLLSDKQS